MPNSSPIATTDLRREFLRELLVRRLEPQFSRRYGTVVLENGLYAEALALGFDSDPQVAFRSAAALEFAYFAQAERFVPHLPVFLSNYLNVTNPSAHRHYTKMMEHMLRTGRLSLSPDQARQVAETAFDRLIDPRTRVAVQVWSMEILDLLSLRLDWVEEHLEETVRHLMEGGSPGIQVRGARLCARIRKRRASGAAHTGKA